jgi:hypothetical protein
VYLKIDLVPRYGLQDLVFGALDVQTKEINFCSANGHQNGVEWEALDFVDGFTNSIGIING